jgi:hypothetical protein
MGGTSGQVEHEGANAVVVWGMTLGLAAIILLATGYGTPAQTREHWPRVWIVIGAAVIWIAAWWPPEPWGHRWVVNPGVAAVGIGAALLLFRARDHRGAALAATLGLVGMVVRLIAPFSLHQASVIPQASLESVGLGAAAGMGTGRPGGAAAAAALAECIAGFLTASVHIGVHQIGRGDFAAVTLAALAAWVTGWVTEGVGASWRKPA